MKRRMVLVVICLMGSSLACRSTYPPTVPPAPPITLTKTPTSTPATPAITPTSAAGCGSTTYTTIAISYNLSPGNGNCGFPTGSYDPNDYAAINSTDYANGSMCGACLAVYDAGASSVTVMVVDNCPTCGTAHELDLGPSAWSTLTNGAPTGTANVTWNVVPCPLSLMTGDSSGDIEYQWKSGCSAYYDPIQFMDMLFPITAVSWAASITGPFTTLQLDASLGGNEYWSNSGQNLNSTTGPFYFVVADAGGGSVTLGPISESDCAVTHSGGVQLPPCGATNTPGPTSTFTSTPTGTPTNTATSTGTETPPPIITLTKTTLSPTSNYNGAYSSPLTMIINVCASASGGPANGVTVTDNLTNYGWLNFNGQYYTADTIDGQSVVINESGSSPPVYVITGLQPGYCVPITVIYQDDSGQQATPCIVLTDSALASWAGGGPVTSNSISVTTICNSPTITATTANTSTSTGTPTLTTTPTLTWTPTATPTSTPPASGTIASAQICVSSDDSSTVYIDGTLIGTFPYAGAPGTNDAANPTCMSVPTALLTGPQVCLAIETQNTAPPDNFSSWDLDITYSNGTHSEITSSGNGISNYYTPAGDPSAAPANDGSGNPWYSPSYGGTAFTTSYCSSGVTASTWAAALYNPITGAQLPFISNNCSGDYSTSNSTGALFWRQCSAIPASAALPGPPNFILTESQSTPVTIGTDMAITYTIVVCNSGGPVTNGPTTVTDNFPTNSFNNNNFQFGCWGYGDSIQPYMMCYYASAEGNGNEPTASGASMIFPSFGTGCVTLTAAVTNFYWPAGSCGTLVDQAAVNYPGGTATSNSVTFAPACAATPTPTVTFTSTNTPTETAVGSLPTPSCATTWYLGYPSAQTPIPMAGITDAYVQGTAGYSGTVSSLYFFVPSGGVTANVGLYSDNGGQPGILLGSSSVVIDASGWNNVALNNPVNVTNGTNYWLGICFSASTTIGGGNSSSYSYLTQSASSLVLPSSYSGGASSNPGWLAVYAYICPSTATATPTSTSTPVTTSLSLGNDAPASVITPVAMAVGDYVALTMQMSYATGLGSSSVSSFNGVNVYAANSSGSAGSLELAVYGLSQAADGVLTVPAGVSQWFNLSLPGTVTGEPPQISVVAHALTVGLSIGTMPLSQSSYSILGACQGTTGNYSGTPLPLFLGIPLNTVPCYALYTN
jgi:hypothetical protein